MACVESSNGGIVESNALRRESGADFLFVLTAFSDTVLSGRCPSDMAAIFFEDRLLTLNQKAGVFAQLQLVFLSTALLPSVRIHSV